MENFNLSNVLVFLIFFLPGFISIKVYDLLISTGNRDFSKALFEAIGFSTINFAILSWLIYLNILYTSWLSYPIFFIISILIVFIAIPVILPFLFLKIIKGNFFSKYIINPILKPWDYVFEKREVSWVIVNLKNGIKIGGKYNGNSYSSSYPANEQIYIEEVWKLDNDYRFIEPIERSNGIIILGDDISSIEFFK